MCGQIDGVKAVRLELLNPESGVNKRPKADWVSREHKKKRVDTFFRLGVQRKLAINPDPNTNKKYPLEFTCRTKDKKRYPAKIQDVFYNVAKRFYIHSPEHPHEVLELPGEFINQLQHKPEARAEHLIPCAAYQEIPGAIRQAPLRADFVTSLLPFLDDEDKEKLLRRKPAMKEKKAPPATVPSKRFLPRYPMHVFLGRGGGRRHENGR